jgi:hypothetical protein
MAKKIKIFPLTDNPRSSNKEPVRRPLPQKSNYPPIEKRPVETPKKKE